LVVECLRHAATETPDKEKAKIEDIATRHDKTLGVFSRIAPSFRATRLLLVAERSFLVANVEEF
jgi:hypothetical protein